MRHITALLLLLAGCGGGSPRQPNFVLILSDDMGLHDTGIYGSDYYETPNIDRFAAQGMRFTNAYAAANVCSPTRAALLTGKHPAQLRITTWIPGHKFPWAKLSEPQQNQQLALEETTIAELLRDAGYRTASFGKWHLGGEAYFPELQGFDETFQKSEREPHYITDQKVTDRAIQFLHDHGDDPFFLYIPYYSVHEPIDTTQEARLHFMQKARADGRDLADPKSRTPLTATEVRTDYAGMVRAQDEQVGRLMTALDQLELTPSTVVMFVSDNGGLARATSNRPLRGGKGTMYEGGTRVPLIARLPEFIQPGSTSDVPVTTTDLFATILELAGLQAPHGQSLVPLLTESGAVERDALYWHFPHYHGLGAVPHSVIRQGDWKLIEFHEDQRLELYDLADDPGESTDLAAQQPDRASQLQAALHDWLESTDAQMPRPNPNHDPERANLWQSGSGTRERTPLP